MPIDYFSSKEGTLAERLDKSWANYQDESLSVNEREQALDFMLYVFDIDKLTLEKDGLNRLLVKLMADRAHKKGMNPNYIPVLASGPYRFDTDAPVFHATYSSGISYDSRIQEAFYRKDLLDVTDESKTDDLDYRITFFNVKQRASFNLEIRHGLFHKSGIVFDSSNFVAHGKKGYVAFTLNAMGELSVFNHLGGHPDNFGSRMTHSSMNAGAPVLIAGEMQIKQGKLMCINTYSGHYQPSLYSINRFLNYLNDRGMDISQCAVLLSRPPASHSGLSAKAIQVEHGDGRSHKKEVWYQIQASQIFHSVKHIIRSNIESINNYLNSPKTMFYRDVLKRESTIAKSKLAEHYLEELSYAMRAMKDSSSLLEISIYLDVLHTMAERYTTELAGIERDSGRLDIKFAHIRQTIQAAQASLNEVDEAQEALREDGFKRSH
ncbi:hypothetical protein [Legionella oakridgensis]|uniref:Uncharacterized protein n=2 Tax=Legionella oakridgensis TaxID=29423 RepID=W0B7Q7_9GAMM|nr:hypothetical protein [Legionella oakridgensis]AHE65885.1 hypothetical protein Loa_00296 [Legionella oakridgensis ATCC 33761 = DSM 21215]KTD39044.1 hypothetical protein Loak_1165 [Legionella oakridgensis]STY15818.1 Uncharacterised protein [Legionella longbeachae]